MKPQRFQTWNFLTWLPFHSARDSGSVDHAIGKFEFSLDPFTYFPSIQASPQGFKHEIMISLYLFSIALLSYFRNFHRTSPAWPLKSGTVDFCSQIEMLHRFATVLSIPDVSFKGRHFLSLFCRNKASFVNVMAWSRFFFRCSSLLESGKMFFVLYPRYRTLTNQFKHITSFFVNLFKSRVYPSNTNMDRAFANMCVGPQFSTQLQDLALVFQDFHNRSDLYHTSYKFWCCVLPRTR